MKLYQRNLPERFPFWVNTNSNLDRLKWKKINCLPLISYINYCAHSLLIKLSMRMKECFLSLVGENNFDEIQTWLSPYILHTKQSCKKYCFKGDIPQICILKRNCPMKNLTHKSKTQVLISINMKPTIFWRISVSGFM